MKHYVLVGLLSMVTQLQSINSPLSCFDYLPSTVTSAVVGAFTGGLTRYLEKEFNVEQSKEYIIVLMIIWWVEHKIRHKVINSLEKDFKEADIPHKKNWMSFSAWLSSWASYIHFSQPKKN